jgi:thiol:disulfide interchange protein DsbA
MTLLKRIGCFAALLTLLAGSAFAQQPVAGREYTVLNPPQPTDSGKKIEVIEFFWYGCIHCYTLEPAIKAWLKRKPADVEFRYVPAIFDAASWGPLARAFYALDAMGFDGKFHDDIFNAIHRDKQKAIVTEIRACWPTWLATKESTNRNSRHLQFVCVNSRTKRSEDMRAATTFPAHRRS